MRSWFRATPASLRRARGLIEQYGNLPMDYADAHTAILMREYGIRRIVTRDTDFHRFPFLEPIDPVA